MTVVDVLVGDVWVLAGQSNMEGIGALRHAEGPHPMVRAFYMDDRWDTAVDPVHMLSDAIDEAHAIIAGGTRPTRAAHLGAGPGVSFAKEMHRLEGVPQGIIACAHGGTTMVQWDPKLREQGGKSLYGAMLRRVGKNGGSVAGVFWYQGCSEANAFHAPRYTDYMKELVASVRRDLDDERMPWTIVQIASMCGPTSNSQYWDLVQEQQRRLPNHIERIAVVPAIDLALEDVVHIAGNEQNRLGRRAARAMSILTERTSGKMPIELGETRVESDSLSGTANVVVTFRRIEGELQSSGRPWGFELTNRFGEPSGAFVFRVDLDGNRAIVRTMLPREEAEAMFLYYGLGRRPYCNITDTADRSLPAFGPHHLGGNTIYGPFITSLQVSRFMPSQGCLDQLSYPREREKLDLRVRQFDGTFCSLHPEISGSGMEDLVVYYAARVHCTETMNTQIRLGYDGPVKMWVDGDEVLFDPQGVNPALPDDSSTPVHLDEGDHDILIALGSNRLKAWGIFLRFVRTDVSRERILEVPYTFLVPQPLTSAG